MKVFSNKTCALLDLAKRARVKRHPLWIIAYQAQQVRCAHDSYIKQGIGGRSSFSGVVATVFGPNGRLGHSVVNHLGSIGTNVMIPYRGTYDRVQRLRVMGDLGQFLYRDNFSIRQDDDAIRELIEHSNCVINLIKIDKPKNHYSMEEVNVDWPIRLANLVAEKNDGTRLIHITYLNCHQEEARKLSVNLRQDFTVENRLREIHPETIIVRSAGMYGYEARYVARFCASQVKKMSIAGSCPPMYSAGRETVIQPVYVSDVAKAIARIASHPDAPSHVFELVGADRFTLHDFVEYLYDIKEMDHIFFDWDSLGSLDRKNVTPLQELFHKGLEFYFWRQFKPRPFHIRAVDILTRDTSDYSWMTFDMFKQLHVTDRTTGAPGFRELGIEPANFEEQALEWMMKHGAEQDFQSRMKEKTVPRVVDERPLEAAAV